MLLLCPGAGLPTMTLSIITPDLIIITWIPCQGVHSLKGGQWLSSTRKGQHRTWQLVGDEKIITEWPTCPWMHSFLTSLLLTFQRGVLLNHFFPPTFLCMLSCNIFHFTKDYFVWFEVTLPRSKVLPYLLFLSHFLLSHAHLKIPYYYIIIKIVLYYY